MYITLRCVELYNVAQWIVQLGFKFSRVSLVFHRNLAQIRQCRWQLMWQPSWDIELDLCLWYIRQMRMIPVKRWPHTARCCSHKHRHVSVAFLCSVVLVVVPKFTTECRSVFVTFQEGEVIYFTYATKIESLQLHDSAVMASISDIVSFTLPYITLQYNSS